MSNVDNCARCGRRGLFKRGDDAPVTVPGWADAACPVRNGVVFHRVPP